MDRTTNETKLCGKDHRHNGWTNYETWAVALWMDNDAGSQSYWCDVADDVYARRAEADKFFTKAERATLMLAEVMKDEHEEQAEQMLEDTDRGPSVFADLMNAALSEVNWHEIAKHYIDAIGSEVSR